ncbi:hypothetical protein [Burkholderia sp. WSM2232]|uniref:hypothetical protein n=1 Tax=Burkholderia sp. WSM2232 TaxID=944436 RepID=UPI000554EB67|nr:hypothetical protein [Burkholderia sp. WSM2232]
MFATGKYQTTLYTLRSGKAALGSTGNEKYDADMQERFFRDYLFNKAGGGALADFVKNGKETIDDAQYAAAQEWASISAPRGCRFKTVEYRTVTCRIIKARPTRITTGLLQNWWMFSVKFKE